MAILVMVKKVGSILQEFFRHYEHISHVNLFNAYKKPMKSTKLVSCGEKALGGKEKYPNF